MCAVIERAILELSHDRFASCLSCLSAVTERDSFQPRLVAAADSSVASFCDSL